jgi:hypothetical protein
MAAQRKEQSGAGSERNEQATSRILTANEIEEAHTRSQLNDSE